MRAQSLQHGAFQHVAADIQSIVAGALVASRRAADQILGDHGIAAAAATAPDEAGEEVLRAPTVVQGIAVRFTRRFPGEAALAFLRGVPSILIDNSQFRNILHDPFAFRVQARDALSRVRIFQVAKPVPDQPTDIELIVEDTGPAFRIAVNGGRSPLAALRSRHALAVQRHGDRSRRLARQILREDAADGVGFGFIDGALAPTGIACRTKLAHDIVAVAKTTARLAVLDTAAQAAPGLVGEVFQVESAHRSLEADMQFADLAFRERNDADAGEAHPLVEAGNILLVARKPVKRFRQDHVEAALQSVGDEFLHTGP